jgi:CRISPR/Cas system-associated exonuclease Cas4 (RecB family)
MNYSYSRLSIYDRCPRKFKFRYIDELDIDTDSPVFEKGKYFHAILEKYPDIPEWDFKYSDNKNNAADMLKQIRTFCETDKRYQYLIGKVLYQREQQFYLNHALENCDEENQFINGCIDYVGVTDDCVLLIDWKSGKTQKFASFKQLELYSIWAFNNFPKINTVKTMLFFIEQDSILTNSIDRTEVDYIKKSLIEKIKTIESDTDYKKCVKEDCHYCEYNLNCKPFKVK